MTRKIIIFPSKLNQLYRLSAVTKCLHDIRFRFYACPVVNHCANHCNKHITSAVIANRTKTLSKAMSGQGDNLDVNYDDLLKALKDEKVLIIDVRENSEIEETGKLPGSIHIPMGEVANILKNTLDQDFEKKFSKKKPDENTKIILSCKAGRRSAFVQSEIQKLGYKNAYNYRGGWLDWESRQAA